MNRDALCRTLPLPDGRRLGYAEYGDPQGQPVVYCHGFPGSRLEGQLAHAAARQLHIRLLAIDRPGYGRSDFLPGRTLLDWPLDLGCFADALGLRKFGLLGVSGGAPYALACAALIPERIERFVLVSPLGPGEKSLAGSSSPGLLRFLVHMGRERPRIYFWIGRLLAGLLHYVPDMLLRLQSRVASAVDHDMLRDADTRAVLQQSGREAFVQKGCGPASDLGIYAENWGFHLQEIRLPGILWQGLADITTPPEIARELAASLPLCRLRLIPEEGHFSLVIRRMHTILADFTAGRNDSFKIESSAG